MTVPPTKAPTNYAPIIIIAGLMALTINGLLIGWGLMMNAQRPRVELRDLAIEGNTVICPGEVLSYKFELTVSKPSDVDLTTYVESASPQTTVSYTRFQRYSFDTASSLTLGRHWLLPPTYLDPELGRQVTWRPGAYVQRTTANVIGSRDGPSEIEVQFTVPNNCVSH